MKYIWMKYLGMYEVILNNLTFLPCISVSFCCFSFCCFSFCCSSEQFHISLAIYIIFLLLATSTQYITDISKFFILFSVFVSVSVMFVPIYISNMYHYSFFIFCFCWLCFNQSLKFHSFSVPNIFNFFSSVLFVSMYISLLLLKFISILLCNFISFLPLLLFVFCNVLVHIRRQCPWK